MAAIVVGGMVLLGFIFILLVLWRLLFGRQRTLEDDDDEGEHQSTFSAVRNLTRPR